MAVKDEFLALSSGIALAGKAIKHIEEVSLFEDFKVCKDEIIQSIIKPVKVTAVHYYLSGFQNVERKLDYLAENELCDMEEIFEFIIKTLDEVHMMPDFPVPDFENCPNTNGHFSCRCYKKVMRWINYVRENAVKINILIVHSAFQILFRDKKFLLKFHWELSGFIKYYIDEIEELYPEYVTEKERIKRVSFPKWLTDAVFYRDMGTCSYCRKDLSNLLRTQNKIHIDHIFPLKKYGSDDASNFQLLCESCNTSKGANIIETSSIVVPFWNLDW